VTVLSASAYEWVEVEEVATSTPPIIATSTQMTEKDPLACSCVRWINHLNPKMPLVDARWYATFNLSGTATIGSAVVLKYPKSYHVAKVVKLGATKMTVSESNFKECEIGERDIEYTDPRIVGFFTP